MSYPLRFTKMHGAGNDYIYIDATQEMPPLATDTLRQLSDRRFGIGGDGVVLIERSEAADLRMRMFNADGSEGAMCGNAIRCVAKFALDRKLTDQNPLTIETASGVKAIHCQLDSSGQVTQATVDMGPPILSTKAIPVAIEQAEVINVDFNSLVPSIATDVALRMTCVSMGNPHAVFFVEELSDELVLGVGPQIETCSLFPDRANIEFAVINNRNEITMRVWERGSGETHACGTGACAVVVAAILNGLTDRNVTVHLLGGDLVIRWPEHEEAEANPNAIASVYKTGPAEFVFDGIYEIGI